MSHILKELEDKGLVKIPSWMSSNTSYLTIMGSIAYGVAEDTSDFDCYGYCIPPKSDLFPYHEKLYLFDNTEDVFKGYQEHHIFDQQALGGKGRNYDFTIYSIVRYFDLCAGSNPNMVDSLFVPQNCILHATAISELVRDHRKMFLSKDIWKKYKGYAYSTLSKMTIKNYKRVQPVLDFERKNKISQTTTFAEVEKEMKKRNLIA
jgi:predicted nucleotidyltransferase